MSRDAITEEKCCKSLPESERMGVRRLPLGQQSLPREPFIRQLTMASTLLTSSSDSDSSDEGTWVRRRGNYDRLPLLKYKTLEWKKLITLFLVLWTTGVSKLGMRTKRNVYFCESVVLFVDKIFCKIFYNIFK